MKKIAAVLGVAVLVTMMGPLAMAAGSSDGKTHNAMVQVLSVDLAGNTLTFKNAEGEQKTATVLKEAQAALKQVNAGDSIMITCRDNADGEHTGISAIKSADNKGA